MRHNLRTVTIITCQ